jgi:hypothetical protein
MDGQCGNPLKTKLIQIIIDNSVRTSKRTPPFTNAKINWLTLFKEVISVTARTIQNPQIQNAWLLIVKAGGTYSSHWALKG